MVTPINRMMARVLTNSVLAQREYCHLVLSGSQPIRIRSLDFRVEKDVGKDGEMFVDADHWVQFDRRHLDEAGVDRVAPGDTFTDAKGMTWQMFNALDKDNGMVRARLIKPQRSDPLAPGVLGPAT